MERSALVYIRPDGRRYWTCPNCNRPIGEFVGTRLVILVSRDSRFSLPIVEGMEAVCRNCQVTSTYHEERKLA